MSQPAVFNIALEGTGGRKAAVSVDISALVGIVGGESTEKSEPGIAAGAELWILGLAGEGSIKQIFGAFSSIDAAAEALRSLNPGPDHFVAPVRLDQLQPAGDAWPGIEFPMRAPQPAEKS